MVKIAVLLKTTILFGSVLSLILAANPIQADQRQLQEELLKAVINNHVEGAERLWLAGASINYFDQEGRTPLFYGAQRGNLEVVAFLVSKGAHVAYRDKYGITPLHFACGNFGSDKLRALAMVRFLLSQEGVEINARDNGKATPLHFAATTDNKALVHLLLRRGANLYACDCQGRTPAEVARGYRQFRTERYLRTHMRKHRIVVRALDYRKRGRLTRSAVRRKGRR